MAIESMQSVKKIFSLHNVPNGRSIPYIVVHIKTLQQHMVWAPENPVFLRYEPVFQRASFFNFLLLFSHLWARMKEKVEESGRKGCKVVDKWIEMWKTT